MNDLLPKPFAPARATSYVDLKRAAMRDLEMGEMKDSNGQNNLCEFFAVVSVIKDDMEKVKQLLSRLQKANEESKAIHKAQAMKAVRDRMDQDMEEVLRKAKSIKTKLENLENANVANRRCPGCELGTPTDRARTSITISLRKKLKDRLEDFQNLRQQIMDEYKDTIERRYYTVTGQKPHEEIVEKIIETGESEYFLQKAIQEQGRGQVIDTIREIQERHDAVRELEKSLLELHQIFFDMAILVETQEEHLNDIEHHVSQANAYIDGGTNQLRTAKQYRSHSRKWMCVAVLLLLILILIAVVIPIAKSFRK